jgi:hypothetical protein
MVKQLLNPLDVTKDKQKVPAVEGHKELLTVQQITDLHNLFAESYSLLSKSEDQDSDVLDVRYELFFLLAFLQGIETHDMHVTIQGHLQGTMLMMKDAIKQNFVSMIGGNIGSMVMTLGAWVAWRVYDGYYPVAA